MRDRLDSNATDGRHKSIKRNFSLNMSISQDIKKLYYTAISSIIREMMQISDLKIIQGVKIEDLSSDQISRIITGNMFLKEKFTPDNSLEKIKSRLVAGGHLQDRDIYTYYM